MSYDYEFKIKLASGREIVNTYQSLIRILAIDQEIVSGTKMTAGGAPQAIFLKQLLERIGDARPEFKDCKVSVYFNGSQIF